MVKIEYLGCLLVMGITMAKPKWLKAFITKQGLHTLARDL
jgi:hypothetical protein